MFGFILKLHRRGSGPPCSQMGKRNSLDGVTLTPTHPYPPPQDKVNQQFNDLGLKPEDVISKVMSDPELASGFSNPKVQAAIIDISQNPMNIVKYQNDPEVRQGVLALLGNEDLSGV